MNEYVKNLESIQKVDAPPYLLTRIRQKISNEITDSVSAKMAWSLGLSFCLIIGINAFVLTHNSYKTSSDGSPGLQSLYLMPENSFYR